MRGLRHGGGRSGQLVRRVAGAQKRGLDRGPGKAPLPGLRRGVEAAAGRRSQGRESVRDIVYSPVVLRSLREICERMGVGKATVRRWATEGAPIAVEGAQAKTRYSAEAAKLQLWREERTKRKSSGESPEL